MEEETLSKRERKKLNREKKIETESRSVVTSKIPVVLLIIVIAAGVFWFMYRGGSSNKPAEQSVETGSPSEVTAEDHIKVIGSAPSQQVESADYVAPGEALVTLVAYEDFQCPACAAYHPIINQLSEEFKDNIRFVFRHFPLRSIHRHAQIAAQAAEAAGAQGKFWEMADILYERQEAWANVRDPRALFKEYADELALNVSEFESYMNSEAAKNAVDADYSSGMAAGINATPTFYINGEKIASNPQGFEPFKELISQIIDLKKAEVSEDTSGPESTESGSPQPSPDGQQITPTL